MALTKTERQVITSAKAAAAAFVEEFGTAPLQSTSDWDSAAYQAGDCGWPDSAWPLYQSTLLAEIARLQAEESEGSEVDEIGDGFFEAADGTVIYSSEA